MTRSNLSGGAISAANASSTSQTATPATTATLQTSQAAVLAQRSQIALQRSVLSLQAIQNAVAAQSAARNLAITGANNLGTPTVPLPTVPDGLAPNGLVPGVTGTDAANPANISIPLPVTPNSSGGASVTIGTNTSLTLPPTAGASSQITVSGSGTVGSITTGGTITPLTAGVTTTIPAGSTISLTQGGTITFGAGSSIPTSVSTYAYTAPATATTPATTVPVPSSWSGVSGLSQATYGTGTGQADTVTVTQTAQQALLTWQSFNIGKNTTLDFDQSLGGASVANWVAINKVAADIAPSQVLGAIQAPGQVYVINQNGIIFGGSSQVNVGALVASSLPINDNLVSRGLLNDPDFQFLFSQLDEPAGTLGPTAAFTPQGTSSSHGSAPAPGSFGANGGLIAKIDSSGNLSLVSPTAQDGDIVVEAGAQLSSPTTPEHVGGRVALVGPNVNNAGTISTPDGQTILAAGLQVGMEAHPSTDPSLRGLDVVVGSVASSAYDGGATGVSGTVTNNGLIDIPRADLTMTGSTVNQDGLVESSTSVSLNGRVDLLANYNAIPVLNGQNGFTGQSNFYPTSDGIVTFGLNSLTEILPELSSIDTVVGSQLALSSLVNVQGSSINFDANSMLYAPGAAVPSSASQPAFGLDSTPLTAGVTLDAGQWADNGGSYALTYTSGQVYLDAGATIDVSGSSDVTASVTEDIISAQLLGTELADSPLQQNGPLRGATIQVNILDTGSYDGTEWVGTPIGDVSGYVNLIEHSVGELTDSGGTVVINAGTSTVMQPGSTIDVSGGWVDYQGASVQTSEVVSNGLVYDISQATPDQVYQGLYTGFTTDSVKYGLTENYAGSLKSGAQYEAGYIQGGNGGSLSITSPELALDGSLEGSTVAGAYQNTPMSQVEKTFASTTIAPAMESIFGAPLASSLTLKIQAQNPADPNYLPYSPTPPSVIFTSDSSLPAAGAFGAALPSPRVAEVDLSPDLVNRDGFGQLTLTDSNGNITVPAGVSLTTPDGGSITSNGTMLAGGSITLDGANIDIEGSVDAPGGSLSFTTHDFSPYVVSVLTPPPIDPTRGTFTLGVTGTLSTAGLVVDNRVSAPDPGQVPSLLNGGSVSISSYNVDILAGRGARDAIDVSGGVAVSTANKLTYGNGGSITIKAGNDPTQPSIAGGAFDWNPYLADFIGFSGASGGSLSVTTQMVQIGGSQLLNGDTTASGRTFWLNETDAQGNLLEPNFFDQGGFTHFALNGFGAQMLNAQGNPTGAYLPGTLIAPDTVIDPVPESRLASLNGNAVDYTVETLADGLRAPVSLSFSDATVKDFFGATTLAHGDFVEDAGAVIEADPQGSATGGVSISGTTAAVLGTVLAPGGAISIKGAATYTSVDGQNAAPSVDLGPDSLVSAQGRVDLVPNAQGYLSGTVLNGGTIAIGGNIIAEAGSVLDVSGASYVLNELPAVAGRTGNLSQSIPVLTEVASNGGSISLAGSQELFTDATLLGSAGGSSALGGSLSVSSGIFLQAGSQTPLTPTLTVTENGPTIPIAAYYPAGGTALGQAVVDAQGHVLPQRGYLAAADFDAGGFGSLVLDGTVQFSGTTPVTLTASQSLSIAGAGVILAGSGITINLDAPYVDLGMAFQPPTQAGQQVSAFDAGGGSFYFSPTYGSATLNVNASLIDVGDLSLQGIGNVHLTAADGDIRGDGTFDASGNVYLTAGQIYPTTDNYFTIADYDYSGVAGDGTVTIQASGSRDLPLSAGGELNVYASNIVQDGVLRAPIGVINLGSGGTGVTPVDYITGSGVPGVTGSTTINPAVNITLGNGSVTSVSAIDTNGQPLVLPYGTNTNGTQWTDPAGNNITTAGNGVNGLPSKAINVSATNVNDQAGAVLDLRGGGDLYSYSFVTGTSGTVDILGSSTSFAVIPGYQATYAPYYSSGDYLNGSLTVGEQVYLQGSAGLPAGVYTLLPARYALIPGAFLVTPESSTPPGSAVARADGSSIVSGYEFNGLNAAQTGTPLFAAFEVAPPSVVASRASYDVLSANTFLSQSATSAGDAVPRLPIDAGQLVLAASQSLVLDGSVESQPGQGGLGGLVDIASASAILIAGPNTDLGNVPSSTLILDSSNLSAFGADSLLIGGYREAADGGSSVTVTTSSLTIDNAGASVDMDGTILDGLSAPDLILVSNQTLTLGAGAELTQAPGASGAPPTEISLTGNGAFIRVSDNAATQSLRTGATPSASTASLAIGAGVVISGVDGSAAGSVTLDSTQATSLDPTITLAAATVNLDSGTISLELQPPAVAPTTTGLVLSETTLSDLQGSATTLSLLSYASIDIYGSGQIGDPAVDGSYTLQNLQLHAGSIRGFSDNGGGGTVTINANDVLFDNSSAATPTAATENALGSLTINAATIELGHNQTAVTQFANVNLNASTGILLDAETKVTQTNTTVVNGTGALVVSGDATLVTPVISSAAFASTQAPAHETITASGDLIIDSPGASPAASMNLGGSLTLTGNTVTEDTKIDLPSGTVILHATDGNVTVGSDVDVAGTAKAFNQATEYTSGGAITLESDSGSVVVADGGVLDVSANPGGGNAGSLTVSSPEGAFSFAAGSLNAIAADGTAGNFSLDVETLAATAGIGLSTDLQALDATLGTDGFTNSVLIRDRSDSQVALSGSIRAATYDLSADAGSITINGTIDASNIAATDPNGNALLVGGTIDLSAAGSLTLAGGSELNVSGANFDNAGEGGSITLAAGAESNGNFTSTTLNSPGGAGPLLDIASGAKLDLSVAANTASSAARGDLTGTLILSAPQTSGNTDLQIGTIQGTILNASSIVVEGNQVFTATDGVIDDYEGEVEANWNTFAGSTATTNNILSRIYAGNSNATAYEALSSVEPGAEIMNPTGSLTLDNTWDLSTFRFGPGVNAQVDGSGAPGILTLRAAGNIVFEFGASLTDGFDTANQDFSSSGNPYWTAPLLPTGDRSWSYQIVAGADFSGANLNDLQTAASLQRSGLGGSVILGANTPALPTSDPDGRDDVLDDDGFFQAIRTGTGDITINAGGNVEIENNLATIYTAGTQASALAGFTTPNLGDDAPQFPEYGAQYSLDGGNVVIDAQGNIDHQTPTGAPDSSLELPTTWLYRQGALDSSGNFLVLTVGGHKVEQTSWWVDFSNYFEGVGALGGGNVTLTAGNNIVNVDASIPTNARMSGTSPNAANLLELGGGDLVVSAGADINGGVYYVERGQGSLAAGNQILTNATRAAVARNTTSNQPISWLPTTLFLGDGSFNITAGGDALLGPVANPFLLPQAINNLSANKSYFSTYGLNDAVDVSSLAGNVTLRDATDGGMGSLANFYSNIYIATGGQSIATYNEPWLATDETSIAPFVTSADLMPATLDATSFSGDVDLVGTLTLSPSPIGTVNLFADDSLNGFQVNSFGTQNGTIVQFFGSSTINLSDANPASIPSDLTPLSSQLSVTNTAVFAGFNALFAESGGTSNLVLQTQEALHAKINGSVLHANDPNPVQLYADSGNISGVKLFAGKETRVIAGNDITDISLYLQNIASSDISLISAGRDIIAYDISSPLREEAAQPGNSYFGYSPQNPNGSGAGGPNAGDIQISGPGTLEVLAGGNLDLGVGPNNANGTGAGLTSIGNTRDPYLPFAGADIVAAAGLGSIAEVGPGTDSNFAAFENQYLAPGSSSADLYLPQLATLMGLPSGDSGDQVWQTFNLLSPERQKVYALDIFYLVLRDAGRNHNSGTGSGYDSGYTAIADLFPAASASSGNISLTSREIKTTNGGNISLLAPQGQVTVGYQLTGNQPLDQGILTVSGGDINIFTSGNVTVGTSRIFTLHGGNVIIWSTDGDIAAGSSSKTVQSAPPTQVLVDPESGSVQTDLAGLATGGGIGVLETVVGAPPSDVDLIAPNGTVDAGDAGIRVSGNLSIAATRVLNAGNIQVGGKSAGVPTTAGINIAGLSAASSAAGAANNAAAQVGSNQRNQLAQQQDDLPSIISVQVIGYGG